MATDHPRVRTDHAVLTPQASGGGWRLPHWRWRTVILGLLAVAVVAGVVVVINSPLMDIRLVRVRGAETVSDEAIAQLAGLRGQNMLLANLGEARERVLSQPIVKDASVSRIWPNGIEIRVEEREPWARWEADGKVWAIDDDGVALDGVEAPGDGPVVRQVSAQPALQAGTRVDLSAVELIRRIAEQGAAANGPEILAYEWSQRTGLIVVTRHGRITFGDGDGFEFKYAVWEELEREAQRRGEPLLAADLRFGTRPRVEIGLGLGRATRIVEP